MTAPHWFTHKEYGGLKGGAIIISEKSENGAAGATRRRL